MFFLNHYPRLARAGFAGYLLPLADLLARLYLARVFFLSGLTKIADWEITLALFSDEYRVPLLSPDWAALLGTAGELVLPVLLLLGVLTRWSTLGLLALNCVAVLAYYHALQDSPAALQDHLEWALLLLLVLALPHSRARLDGWLLRLSVKRAQA
ncbi:DoxX family protein [Chitinilyticum aquatile]|uniref:DoxX family protein n=1 Tax=Chitinilyticum aquatile TaxID=362520 RepID=UPI0003F8FD1F|nr:DoxX family protein [Chitinilyticum aquatile]